MSKLKRLMDMDVRLRQEAENAIGFLTFLQIGQEPQTVELVDGSNVVMGARAVRSAIMASLALCISKICDQGKDAYSLFAARNLVWKDGVREALQVTGNVSQLNEFTRLTSEIGRDPNLKRWRDFRNYSLAHLIPDKYASGIPVNFGLMLDFADRSVRAVFALNAGTGSVTIGVDAVAKVWAERNRAYWNQLLRRS